MIRLKGVKFAKNGIPILSKKKIENFVNRQLMDYKKDYFSEIKVLDIDDFIENYLNIHLYFKKLSIDGSILGATCTGNGKINVFNSDDSFGYYQCSKGDIFVDENSCQSENQLRFTMAHETGHNLFTENITECDSNNNIIIDDAHLIGSYYSVNKIKKVTDWKEWQADVYAACLLMPRQFITKLYKQKHDEYFKYRKLVSSRPKRLWKIIYDISSILNVSQTSVAIRLKELFLISEKQYEALHISGGSI